MKVALLYPGIDMGGFARGVRPKTGYMQHGLCHISSALKKEGHEVSLIDLRELFGWEELPALIRKINPDIAGITMMSMDFDAALESARVIKKTNGRVKTIVGGIHPTLMESELIDSPHIDYIFKGEAEVTFPKILNGLVEGKAESKVITGEKPDLDKIPFVDRFLFKTLESPWAPCLRMPFITSIAGRGCVYNCNFCQPAERKLFGARVRRVSPERFVEELEFTKRTIGLESLMIHDDCLVEDKKWVGKFLTLYGRKGLKKPFVCQARADIVVKNPGLFRDMKRCGLAMLLIGFESGSQRILDFLKKGTTVEQNYKAAETCKKLGIRIFANYMLGVPTETREEALETVKMIKRIAPYTPSPAFYTPLPGSNLFDYCEKNNLSLIKNHSEYKRNPTTPKIKGIDYEFLNKALEETTKMSRGLRFRRKMDKMKVRRFNRRLTKRHPQPTL
jgi:radical SAM superfamily enzyme YgiQ (UPF0313 family)